MSNTLVTGIFGAVFAVIGIGLLYFSVSDYRSTSAFIAETKKAEGTVIEMIEELREGMGPNERRGYVYLPRVEFIDNGGIKQIFTSNSANSELSVGEIVEVFYREDKPEDARINSFSTLWLPPIIMALFGVIFILVGSGVAWLVTAQWRIQR
ncbi:MAG: DUF3592 domain-containing protein [Cohaesibacteraceae bacterium]|nr:DUF3592 domain-containing protein [Cohaesibacteraceae bacterium]MBL4876303.1 DUF3592 domain-containing protein [Cohaesibacteraceae bacterium]